MALDVHDTIVLGVGGTLAYLGLSKGMKKNPNIHPTRGYIRPDERGVTYEADFFRTDEDGSPLSRGEILEGEANDGYYVSFYGETMGMVRRNSATDSSTWEGFYWPTIPGGAEFLETEYLSKTSAANAVVEAALKARR